jgi:hypothetical protein
MGQATTTPVSLVVTELLKTTMPTVTEAEPAKSAVTGPEVTKPPVVTTPVVVVVKKV